MSTSNDTKRCFTRHAIEAEPPLIQNGQITFQIHHVGWIVAGIFTILATVVSLWLISKHLMWYTKKRQQRYIVRLLLMVPIYAIVSLASYVFWNHAIPITLVRDSYESFVLYSFFYLLLQYLSPTPDGQKDVFRKVKLDKWMFPMGFVKYRPDGLYFLQLMKWGVLQYCVVRPGTTLAAVILDYIGLYCDDSWSPAWGHVYITIIVSLSVTIAMYCLFQLYIPIAGQLSEHKPLLKLFSVKAVVFLTFWQATFLSLLSMFGVVKGTLYMTADDINNGIAAILETFEMTCFAFLHIWAFSYLPYRSIAADQTRRLRSLVHAIDIRDMWREIRDGSVYMGKTMRGVETDEEARRRLHFAKVMGRERHMDGFQRSNKENVALLTQGSQNLTHSHYRSKDIFLSESADRFGEDFQDGVEKELLNRNLAFHDREQSKSRIYNVSRGHVWEKRSWWRGVYERVSQSGNERDIEEHRPSRLHHDIRSEIPSLDSPPPPPSIIFDYSEADSPCRGIRKNPLIYEVEQSSSNSTHTQATPLKLFRVARGGKESHNAESTSGIPNIEQLSIFSPPSQSTKDIMAPRPVSLPRNRDFELLSYWGGAAPASTSVFNVVGQHLHPDPSVSRPESLLDRLFVGLPPSTVTGYTNSNPSHDADAMAISGHTLPRGLLLTPTFPNHRQAPSLPASPQVMHAHETVSKPRRSNIEYGKRRPRIVLPAPLSSAAQPSHQQHAHAGAIRHIPVGDQQVRHEHTSFQDYGPFADLSGGCESPRSPVHPIAAITVHHISPPESRDAPSKSQTELPLNRFSLSADTDSYPMIMNPPGSPHQYHQLRHTRGDVGRDSRTRQAMLHL